MIQNATDDKFTTLRQRAEGILRDRPANLAALSVEDIQTLIHNLQVHQIELELQNEELRRAHLELEAAHDRYAELYNFAPVGYFTLNTNGAIVEANLTGAALLNVVRSSLIGSPLSRFVTKEDRAKYAVYRAQLGQSQEPQTVEIRLVRRNNTPFYARLEGVTRYDGEARFIQSRIAVSDVTERVQAAEVALKASRLEIAATLAGGIAHDINNLMTAVLGNAELLRSNLSQPDAPDMLAAIARSAQRAGELAQQMLAFARGGKYRPTLLNLNDAIQESLQLQEHAIPGSLVIEKQLAPDLWNVVADASQMNQVMVNLLTNAIEASEGSGHISISTDNLVIDEPETQSRSVLVGGIRVLKPGRCVVLTVKDVGSGMSNEVLTRVFEPFFTTKFHGRGMGLAAVYGIVQNHGGDISVESKVGHGTTVKVYLPVA